MPIASAGEAVGDARRRRGAGRHECPGGGPFGPGARGPVETGGTWPGKTGFGARSRVPGWGTMEGDPAPAERMAGGVAAATEIGRNKESFDPHGQILHGFRERLHVPFMLNANPVPSGPGKFSHTIQKDSTPARPKRDTALWRNHDSCQDIVTARRNKPRPLHSRMDFADLKGIDPPSHTLVSCLTLC